MNDSWETPDDLFNKLDEEFGFYWDVCASEDNSKTDGYWSENDDCINRPWNPFYTYWMNPPYSRGNIGKFIKKAYEESLEGATVVCLVRFDPSTKWFQEYVHSRAKEVRMLARRVKFVGADSAYNFPCCVVAYEKLGQLRKRLTEYYIWDWRK